MPLDDQARQARNDEIERRMTDYKNFPPKYNGETYHSRRRRMEEEMQLETRRGGVGQPATPAKDETEAVKHEPDAPGSVKLAAGGHPPALPANLATAEQEHLENAPAAGAVAAPIETHAPASDDGTGGVITGDRQNVDPLAPVIEHHAAGSTVTVPQNVDSAKLPTV